MIPKNNVKDMGIFRVYLCKAQIGGIECKKINLIVNTQDKLEHSNYVFPTYQFAATIIPTPIILDNFILNR